MMDRCSTLFALSVLLAFQTIYGIGCDDCTLKCGSDAACRRQCPQCDDAKGQARQLDEDIGTEEELEDLFDNVDIDELMTDLSEGTAAEFDDDFDPDLVDGEEGLPQLAGIPTEPLVDPLTGLPLAAEPSPLASQSSNALDLGLEEEPVVEESVTSGVPVVPGETIVTEPSLLDPAAATAGTLTEPVEPTLTSSAPLDATEPLDTPSETTVATEPGLLDATGPTGTAAEPGTDFEPIGVVGEPVTAVEPTLGAEGGVGAEPSLLGEATVAPLLTFTSAPVMQSASATTPLPAPIDAVPTADELPDWATNPSSSTVTLSPVHDKPSLDDPLKGTTPEKHDNIGRNGQHGIAFSAVLMAAVVFALIYFTFCRRPRRRDGMREMEMSTWVNGEDDNGIL